MYDPYLKPSVRVIMACTHFEDSIPYFFFGDEPLKNAVRNLIQAKHRDENVSESWHTLNNRFITLLSNEADLKDPVKTAKECTRYIANYIDCNLESLTGRIRTSPATDIRREALKENIEEIFKKLALKERFGLDNPPTNGPRHSMRVGRPNLFSPHTTSRQ